MTILWILLAVSILALTAVVRSVLHDGRGARPPASHLQDPAFLPPSSLGGRHHDAAA